MQMRLRSFVLFFFLLCATGIWAQETYTISGYIKDGFSGETLIGANVYIVERGTGTISNEYGFYSVTLPVGEYNIAFSYIGFITDKRKIELNASRKLDIELVQESKQLEEVLVTAEAANRNVSETEMSVNRLDINTIQKMPSLLGEVEIIRSLLLLPGVSTVGEGATGFNVRGGSIDQNLILLDEAPVYNSSHLFGFFSVFNPDAVKDVKLFKGGIPSRYGGRLSSVLDVRMKEGNKKTLEMNGGIGAIFSRLSVEAPIVKDKASFIVAGRRSYIDVLAKPFLNDDLKESILNFYDLTAKANWDIDGRNRVFLSGYTGRDNFGFGDQAGFNWGNKTLSFRWNHLFSDRLFSNITLYASDYDYKIRFGNDAINRFDWSASIINYSVKPELTYFVKPGNLIKFGGQGILYRFVPGNAVGISEGEETNISIPDKFAQEAALYFENEIDINSSLTVNYGLRWSFFNYTGKGEAFEFADAPAGVRRPVISRQTYDQWESIKTYNNLEPRVNLKYQFTDDASFKLSYNRTAQYLQLVSNTAASTPVDIWTPSTNNIRPQTADQIALGYFRNLKSNAYELSVEVYYKKFHDLVDYIDGADLLLNQFIEGDLLPGIGRAYGLEFMLQKTKGKFTGWTSYTLSRTERKIDGINNGDWYPARFDQAHNFSAAAFYELNRRWTFSSNFVLISGTPLTFPTTRYSIQGYTIPHNDLDTRNNVRIPVYHRLDVSATLQGKKNPTRRWQSEWVFSVYNVYSRRNPFSIYFAQSNSGATEAVRLSVVGNFIPSVTYNFKF